MTGFGVADGPVAGGRLQVEIRTVNHRHFNVQLRLPVALQPLEETLRQHLRGQLERGHVSVSARWLEEPVRPDVVAVDVERARAVVTALEQLRAALDLPGAIDLQFVARQPGVIRLDATGEEPAIDNAAVLAVVDGALAGVLAMREREGTVLVRELELRLDLMRQGLERVRARAPERLTAEHERLRSALTELLDGREPDPQRLAQEIALLADRLDVTEETVRLAAHLDAAHAAIRTETAPGRRLGFLGQEILREVNTIGSKANDAAIAQVVIDMKQELERFREQLENLE
jgi:uncharacterized protein (TIGR00255 family)